MRIISCFAQRLRCRRCLWSAPRVREDWPSRPVRIIAPFAPGGTADTLGRIAAEHLSEALHQQFYVENRGGGGGVPASLAVARMEPDGYNFVVSGIATHAIAPAVNPNTGYDPVKDFTHVAYFGGPPIVFIVPTSLGVKTLGELVAYAKKHGRETHLRVARHRHQRASGGGIFRGQGRHRHRARSLSRRRARRDGCDGRHLRFGSMTWTTASGQISAGTVVPLAVSSDAAPAGFSEHSDVQGIRLRSRQHDMVLAVGAGRVCRRTSSTASIARS